MQNGPANAPSLSQLRTLLSALPADDEKDRVVLEALIRDGVARSGYAPTPQADSIPSVMNVDLRLRGGAPDLTMLNGTQTVWDLGGALRDVRPAKGSPAFIQIVELNAQAAGVATSVGYTVPLLRQARIDYIVMNYRDGSGLLDVEAWAVGQINIFPAGTFATGLVADVISQRAQFNEGPKAIVINGPIFLAAGDNVNSTLRELTLDPAGLTWSMSTGIFGIEIDAGSSFENF